MSPRTGDTTLTCVCRWPVAFLILVILSTAQPTSSARTKRASRKDTSSKLIRGDGDGKAGANGGSTGAVTLASVERAYNYTAFNCSLYDVTYSQIESDLEIHRKMGSTLNSTRYIAWRLGSVAMRGLTIGFFGGRAYLLRRTDFQQLQHHAVLHVAYIRMLLHLEASFGTALPDVAFVLTTSDTPRYVPPHIVNISSPPEDLKSRGDFQPGPYPVFGIGKSDFFPDLLLVPNFHFHMKMYDETSLGIIPFYNDIRWEARHDVMFGRFSHYKTNRHEDDHYTLKKGINGSRICHQNGKTCAVREYFAKHIVPQDPDRLRVSLIGRVPMWRHAEYKYLMHLDGQGISSRLEQLLPMGSVVFKAQSGYYAYYYRSLLRHRVNMIEFWREGPEDVLLELDWAQANDDLAREIGAAGQRTAATYLTGNGRTCYWYRLLHGLRSTLSYTPALSQWPQAQPLHQVVTKQLLSTPEGTELYALPWAP